MPPSPRGPRMTYRSTDAPGLSTSLYSGLLRPCELSRALFVRLGDVQRPARRVRSCAAGQCRAVRIQREIMRITFVRIRHALVVSAGIAMLAACSSAPGELPGEGEVSATEQG